MKKLSARRLKRHRVYTIEEAALAIGGKPDTLYRWARWRGLTVIKDKRPMLVSGAVLIEFIKKRNKPKFTLGSTEAYCFDCHEPRPPAFAEMALVWRFPKGGGRLLGLCSFCACLINKHVSAAQLDEITKLLTVTNNVGL